MSFIKKNYEKILLGAVLLGLLVSLLLLPVMIQHDKDVLQGIVTGITQAQIKPLEALVVSRETNVLIRVQSPYMLDFETTNRVFNTMQWQRAANGQIFKIVNGSEIGPRALKVTNITPLNYILKLESIEPANQLSAARYQVSVEHEAATNPMLRRAKKHFLSLGEKEGALSLLSVGGAPNDPQLIIQILESGEKVTVTMSKPFREVEGYEADLTYPPEGKKWNAQREGAALKFYNNNEYNIVVIDQNEVVVSAQANQKRTTVLYSP